MSTTNTGISVKFSKEFADKVGILEFSGGMEYLDSVTENAMMLLELAGKIRSTYTNNSTDTLRDSTVIEMFPNGNTGGTDD